ncbi:hypothetical protein [Candidatus Palauibacter sp.]|uniref:hypothetical protein n=1 Tax=Candidatus Palauibacter sp. TaxID=3101350 RepID=UPI003B012BEB
MSEIQCPWCSTTCNAGGSGPHHFLVRCDVCGQFELEGFFEPADASQHLTPMQRVSLSHYARTKWDVYASWLERVPYEDTPQPQAAKITPDVVTRARNGEFLASRAQQADNAIRHIGDRVLQDGSPATIPYDAKPFAAAIGAPNKASVLQLMGELEEHKIVSWDAPTGAYPPSAIPPYYADLRLAGWERYEAMTHGSHDGGYGFFAWQFSSEHTKRVFQEVLRPKFNDLGCPLKDLSDLSQPGVIDNIMRDRIRNASYVIVDLTDHNRGAYWEGGFAEALGKPVVYIMEQAAFDEKKPHFDTNHCTIVFWGSDTDEEFVEKLVATLRQDPGEIGF